MNGETLLDGRFIKYRNFFLDTENNFKPIGLLAVANNLYFGQNPETHDVMSLFNRKGDKN